MKGMSFRCRDLQRQLLESALLFSESELAVKVTLRLRIRKKSLLDYRTGESFQLTADCGEGYYLPGKTSELICDILPSLSILTLQFLLHFLGTRRVPRLVRGISVVSCSCNRLTLLAVITDI